MSMDSWKLREEIYRALSRWYLILAFILLGGITGLVISYLVPPPYQAAADLYVGIDIKRVNQLEYIIPLAEEEPLNLDDYKNWQLKQVSDILKSDLVLQTTLSALQDSGTAWSEWELDDFRAAVNIYWYEAGTWRLEVTHPDKDLAVQAVEVWLESGHAKLSELLESSRSGDAIDQDIWTYNLAISDLRKLQVKYEKIQKACSEWVLNLDELPENDLLDSETYTGLTDRFQSRLDDVNQVSGSSYTIPGPDSEVIVFKEWLAELEITMEKLISELGEDLTTLREQRNEQLPTFYEYLDDSLGLSANVVLQPETSGPQVHKVYSSESYTIGGGLIGFLAWLIYIAVGIGSRKEDHG